jgi:hypothetical protein
VILCPNCQHKETEGALFCSECGAPLESGARISTQNIKRVPTSLLKERIEIPTPKPIPPISVDAAVSLYLMDAGQILPLEERLEFTVGRSAQGQPILPDIDLAQFRAYEYGVSRLHLSIKINGQQITVTDLGSVNGTWLNGQKISSHKANILNHGDILILGKLKVQVLIRR